MKSPNLKMALWAACALGALVVLWIFSGYANAADLGGNCCADLEDRVADLEATTAKKGTRKISLTVYGQVNKAMLYWDVDDGDVDDGSDTVQNTKVIDNSNDPSFVGFAGRASFIKDWSAGYVLEVGVGGRDIGGKNDSFDFGVPGDFGGGTNNLYIQRAYIYMDSAVGKLSLGHLSQATDEITWISTARGMEVAARPLSLRPLIGPQTLEVLDLFDGNRTDGIRYDTPSFNGFTISGSWSSIGLSEEADLDNVWDVALRYAGEFSGLRVGAGVGYRDGIVINGDGFSGLSILASGLTGIDGIAVLSGSASVMHITSGVFLNGAYGQMKVDQTLGDTKTLTGWHLQGGVEQKFFSLGKTTVYGEYGQFNLDDLDDDPSTDLAPTIWGFGVVQNIEGASFDLYGTVRMIDGDTTDLDATIGMAGARIRF